jgi:hypothetical protein
MVVHKDNKVSLFITANLMGLCSVQISCFVYSRFLFSVNCYQFIQLQKNDPIFKLSLLKCLMLFYIIDIGHDQAYFN